MGSVRVGTCGFSLRAPEYFDTFRVVELPRTAERLPPLSDAQRWRAEAPDGFEFTLRALAAITHSPASAAVRRRRLNRTERSRCGGFRDTPVVRKAWRDTLALARALEARIVIFRCPSSFRPSEENIANLVRFFQWAHRDRLRLAWEPGSPAWTDEEVRRLCRELSLTHVTDPFQRPCLRPRPPYFRLRGTEGRGHRYTAEELQRVQELCTAEVTYCMFSNGSMADDARRFQRRWETAS